MLILGSQTGNVCYLSLIVELICKGKMFLFTGAFDILPDIVTT